MKLKQLLAGISAGLIGLGMTGSADAVLIGRLAVTPGGTDYQAYYDDVAKLTWLADANYAQTSGYDTDGLMSWWIANSWANGLTVNGVDGWRLPDTLQPDPSCDKQSSALSYGYNCTGSEMGDLFYNALGNPAGSVINTGPFSNVQLNVYWTGAEYTFDNAPEAVTFVMYSGYQALATKRSGHYGWAVQSGDVVPVPASMWLFGSGLLGLIGVARRKKA